MRKASLNFIHRAPDVADDKQYWIIPGRFVQFSLLQICYLICNVPVTLSWLLKKSLKYIFPYIARIFYLDGLML